MIFSEAEVLGRQIDDHVTLAAFWLLWRGGAIDEAPACKTVPEVVDWLNQDTIDKGWNDENTNRAARRGHNIEILECWLDDKCEDAERLVLNSQDWGGGTTVAKTSENRYPKLLVEVRASNERFLLFAVDLLANTVESVSSTLVWTQSCQS